MLNIKTEMGDLIHREVVQVQSYDKRLVVRLRSPASQWPASGVVSIKQLTRKPAKEAQKAFRKSLKSTEKGESAASRAGLEEAVRLDTEYMQAINNLGVRYLIANRVNDAIAQFQRAIAIDPACSRVVLESCARIGHQRSSDQRRTRGPASS